MKKLILFLFVLGFVLQTSAYDKKSLVERFTNASCAPCAALNNAWYNTTTQNMVNNGTISHLVYNVNWPGPNDPMYLLNSTDNMNRRAYYSVQWVPWIDINGTQFNHELGQTSFINTVNSGNGQYAPFNIEITQEALSENLIQVGIKIIRDPNDVTTFGNVKLRLALTEKTVAFASPPGSNGESEFFSICRKMLPDGNGSSFAIPAPGEFVELSLQYVPTTAFLQAVNLDSLRFVAFIQDDNSKMVYQSNMLEAVANYVAQFNQTSPDVIADNNTPAAFTTVLRNSGVMNDTYNINPTLEAPAGWTGEYTTVNGTFPFGQTDSVQVASGDSTVITVTTNPNGINGSGVTTVNYVSKNEPGVNGSVLLHNVTTTGVNILVIDASGENYGSLVSGSLDNVFQGTHGIVSSNALNVSTNLDNFLMVAWSAGISLPVFQEAEVDLLQDYLDGGGKLFINGQDIGADIFGTGGQSQFAQGFYNNYLHASFVGNGTSFLINGYAGDPITDGVQFVLNDTYTRSPDNIAPFDANATEIFKYLNGPNVAGIKATTSEYKVVYFGFGFEQITETAIRDTLIARIIRWAGVGVTKAGDEELVVREFGLEQNYPNPFNPSTKIRYTITEGDAEVSLKVYDIMGREVEQLVNGKQSAGEYEVEFDASKLASGMYIYKLTAGEKVSVKKMTLLK
jgi:hypothetical protein